MFESSLASLISMGKKCVSDHTRHLDCCEHRCVTILSHPSGVPVGLFAGAVASSHRSLSDVMDKLVRL